MKLPNNVTEDDVEIFIGIVKTIVNTITASENDEHIGVLHGEHIEQLESFIIKWEGKK